MIVARPSRGRSLAARAVGQNAAVWRFDGVLLVAVLALAVVGTLLVWSSTRTWTAADPTTLVKKHVLLVGIGFALMSVVAMVDIRVLRAYTPLIYGAAMAGLVAVATPLGSTVNGSHSWIMLGGGFGLQPSELAKPALILMIASLLAQPSEGTDRPRTLDMILTVIVAGLAMGLIMLQPDLGTAMVLSVIALGVLVFAGLRKRWIIAAGVAAVAGAALVWSLGVLKPYQVARFTAFLNPASDPRGVGYNSTQALIAIGSGEVYGKGLFHGGQTTGRFVPEQHTDFIFTVAGEEFGFIGALGVVALLGVVLLRGIRIARTCEDRFGALIAGGVVCWFAFQMFINIGMTIGIMPITGLPLPFVSYGGTATFANMIAIGLLQAVHITGRAPA